MNVLVIADPHIPVPPRQYGGTERMVGFFCHAMCQRGFHIDLMAAPGSITYSGRTYFHRPPTLARAKRIYRKLLFQITSLIASRKVDLVFNFGRLDYLWSLLRIGTPIICRFANPVIQRELDWVLARARGPVRFLGISNDQMQGLKPRELIDVIYNPTDTEYFTLHPTPMDPPYLAFLGRLTSNKGVDLAIEVARQSGIRLKIAGNVSNEAGGVEFFNRTILPQLCQDIEYIGPVDDEAKRIFLGGAMALLFPIRWAEPFGIVMIESLSCGTPVIATRRASTPEVIRHGQTGFLCDSISDMVQAVKKIGSIDRRACRSDAEGRFSQDAIAGQHAVLMRHFIGSGS